MGYCILLTGLMLRFLESNRINDPGAKLLALMSGLPKNRTMDGIEELHILSKKFKRDNEVRRILRKDEKTYDGNRKELKEIKQGRQFIEAFESILSRYGHRRLARDLIEPSWSDEPMIPFIMLKNMLLATSRHDLLATKAHGMRERKRAKREILDWIPIFKRPMFKFLSRYLVRYVAFRELQRFYLDMILSRMRLLFLAMGDRMVEDGIIEDKKDIFFWKSVRSRVT
jgi:pyruvate,water dikinase